MARISVSSLKKRVWKLFSEYIRRKYASYDMVQCVTCGKRYHWKQLQAGHFVGGRHNAVLFDEKNVHPQCYACNIMKHGDTLNYLDFMKKTYGMRTVNALREKDRENKQFSIPELEKLLETYKKKLTNEKNQITQ